MATLVWDQVGERFYEAGIEKGVLYKHDGFGIPWNGLISVEEDMSNEVDPVYFDGTKINDVITLGDYSATLRAFTYPEEFLYYEGTLKDQKGFYVYNQPQSKFGLSYQTKVGNDVSGMDAGYKIHVLYNLTAIPSQRLYQTLSIETTPLEFEWQISSIPEEISGFRPTAYVAFDSRALDPHLLADIEDILYGDEENDARLPSLKGLSTFIRKWNRLIITDHGDGTWSADSQEPGVITMLDSTTFQIISDTAEYVDTDTYTISSSDKNEEDL